MLADKQEEWEEWFRDNWRDYNPIDDVPFDYDLKLQFLYLMACIADGLNALSPED